MGSGLHRDESVSGNTNNNARDAVKNNAAVSKPKRQKKELDSQQDETFSSYGTTQVNILTVQEVQVAEPPQAMHPFDPFSGFGPLSPTGSMSPFGILGGLFGMNPFQIQDDPSQPNLNSASRGPWARGSKSVSSSTRTGYDEDGKRISTTVKTVTTVDEEGNRRVETETIVRHLEDGRVERKMEVKDDKSSSEREQHQSQAIEKIEALKRSKEISAQSLEAMAQSTEEIVRHLKDEKMEKKEVKDDKDSSELEHKLQALKKKMAQSQRASAQAKQLEDQSKEAFARSREALAQSNHDEAKSKHGEALSLAKEALSKAHESYSLTQEAQALHKEASALSTRIEANRSQAAPRNKQTKPLEIAMIATDSRFGISVTDSKMNPKDPSLPNLGDASKWRKTEYFFKLGRFFPTLGVVSQYYSEKEKSQYAEQQSEKKQKRWEKAMERDKDNKQSDALSLPKVDNSKTQYYLTKISEQMGKNLEMMKIFAGEIIKPEFPKKVYHTGEKIVDQLGPTAERTGKLMKDVFGMWFGSLGWSGDDGRRR